MKIASSYTSKKKTVKRADVLVVDNDYAAYHLLLNDGNLSGFYNGIFNELLMQSLQNMFSRVL